MVNKEDSEAVELFIKATEEEGKGNISDAIKFYSQAYRLSPTIDKNEELLEKLKEMQIEKSVQIETEKPDTFNYVNAELEGEILTKTSPELTSQSNESELFRCVPVWLQVFEHLKPFPPSFENFSASSSYLYALSRLYTQRLSYINSLRMRFDGVYIAKFTYFREGESLFSYTHPLHLITYYRYLRFFEDGTVLSLVTPSEPKRILDLIKNWDDDISMEKRGDFTSHDDSANLFRGKWEFSKLSHTESGNEAHFKLVLRNKSGRGLEFIITGKLYNYPRSILHRSNVIKLETYVGYSPTTTTRTKTTRNRIEEREEMIRFDVDQWPRFRFSRVKSYHQVQE
jgi:hypothetical protein